MMKHSTLLSTCLRAGFCMILLLSAHKTSGQAVKTISLIDGSIKEGYEETIPTRDVEIVEDGVIVTYTFHHMTMQPDNLYEGAYFLKMKGFGLMDIPGLPSVPTHMDSFTIPEGYIGTVSVLDSSFVEIQMQLAPARQPLRDGDYLAHSSQKVTAITTYKGYFPQYIITGLERTAFCGKTILKVSWCPIKYNNQNKRVIALKKVKYKVTFIKQSIIQKKDTAKREKRAASFFNNVTLNGNSYSSIIDSQNNRSQTELQEPLIKDYLIISVPNCSIAVNQFADWKRMMGYNVHVESRPSWNTNSIKSFVECMYDSLENLVYLLIVGGHNEVPAAYSSLIANHYTDYYYGCINNNTYQEVCIGRIPVETNQEAEIVFNKIIEYERNPVDDEHFYQTGLNCAFFQDGYWIRDTDGSYIGKVHPDNFEDTRFVRTSEDVQNYLTNEHGYNIKRIYCTDDSVNPGYWSNFYSDGSEIPFYLTRNARFPWIGSNTQIQDTINSGCFYILYRGHGIDWGWGNPNFENNNLNRIFNYHKYPVVFSLTCLTGKFNYLYERCFCDSFLGKENGGCVGIFGASEDSFSGFSDVLTLGMFDAIWPTPGLLPTFPGTNTNNYTSHIPIYSLGEILRQGKKTLDDSGYLTEYTSSPNFRQYINETFHCFGDPSMQIITQKPTIFTNVSIEGGLNMLCVDLGSDSGTITFYNQQSDSVACFVGSHADYVGPTDSLVVCISGHNRIPYITTPESFQTYYIQNETVGGTKSFTSDTIKVGSNVTTAKPSGPVVFNGTKTTIIGRNVEIMGETTIELGTEFEISSE